ncbi:MAG: hypothetical protein M3157_02485, partial [Actinomycetota bacterium]|nr:hypothetical protein [Actinomycetota bacterium]
MGPEGSGGEIRQGLVTSRGWPVPALAPVVVGALWSWWGLRTGAPGALVGGLPGALLFAAGLSNLLWAGNARIFQFMALGALSGVPLS